MSPTKRAVVFFSTLAFLLLRCVPMRDAQAQIVSPSQVTPQTLRPVSGGASIGILLPAVAGLAPPPGAENLHARVGSVVIDGGFDELAGPTARLVETAERRRLSVSGIYALANELERAYAKAGFVLVRVAIPPQHLVDGGPLKIVIVDGFVEDVQVKDVPERVRSVVQARMARLIGRRHITLDEIERALLIAGDTPGLRMKSTLAPGGQHGATTLVLEGEQHLVTGGLGADNRQAASLGVMAYNNSVSVNSPFGFGEQFYGTVIANLRPGQLSEVTSRMRVLGGGLVVPLNEDGWLLNPEYTNSRTQPATIFGAPSTVGRFQRLSFRTSYPLIRTRDSNLAFNGTVEYLSQNLAAPQFFTDIERDRYVALRFALSQDALLPWGQTAHARLQFSKGVGGRSGAEALADGVPLSRQFAGPHFTKVNFDGRIAHPLPAEFELNLLTRAQSSFGEALLRSEQFLLDGTDALSAFTNGALPVDEGATFRTELSHPVLIPFEPGPIVIQPYGFGAFGLGRIHNATAVETTDLRAGSSGGGLRSAVNAGDGFKMASFGLEIARQYINVPRQGRGWRAFFNVSLWF